MRRRRRRYADASGDVPSYGSGPRRELHRSFTWAEWLEQCEHARTYANAVGPLRDASWSGAESFDVAVALARRGWSDGIAFVRESSLPKVESMASALVTNGGWQWDVTGAAFDVGEYLSGAPECWLTPAAESHRPVITLQSDVFLSAGVSTDAVRQRGGATVALALALERAGYAVRVEIVTGNRFPAVDAWIRVVLTDDGGGPLDLDRALFALVHPAFVRWLCLPVKGTLAGLPVGVFDVFLPPTTPCPWGATLRVPSLRWSAGGVNWDDSAQVDKWVTGTFAQLTQATQTGAHAGA